MALSGIRTLNLSKPLNDGWLNDPYFEGVRAFLVQEGFEPEYNHSSYCLKIGASKKNKNGYSTDKAGLKIVVCSRNVFVSRLNWYGNPDAATFDDGLPRRVKVMFAKCPFKLAYNKLFDYIENIWGYKDLYNADLRINEIRDAWWNYESSEINFTRINAVCSSCGPVEWNETPTIRKIVYVPKRRLEVIYVCNNVEYVKLV